MTDRLGAAWDEHRGGGCVAPSRLLRWRTFEHVLSPLSVAMGRSDGLPVLAADGKLYLLHRSGRITRFAPGYAVNPGDVAETAVSGRGHRGCTFGASRGSPTGLRLMRSGALAIACW